jgi:hypothetical protein
MNIFKRLKRLIYKLIGRQYVLRVDASFGKDYTCVTEGYFKDGILYIEKQKIIR